MRRHAFVFGGPDCLSVSHTLTGRLRRWPGRTGFRIRASGIELPQLNLGDPVGLHHETDHRVRQHFVNEELGQCPAGQLVPRAGPVQVGKGNGERSRKARMRCPRVQFYQNRGFPSRRIQLIRGRSQLRFDLVLSRRERLGKAGNREWPRKKTATVLLVSSVIFVVLRLGGAGGPSRTCGQSA